jgi:hypothetical protein
MSQQPAPFDAAGDGAAARPLPFGKVPERGSSDHLLRLLQQHHVQLSTMADTKANIIITVSSIVLTLVLGRVNDPDLRLGLLVLGVFSLLALLLAILAVLPKFRRAKPLEGALPPGFNVLFFGHFTALDQQRYLREMAEAMMPGRAYETVVSDVYVLGQYLALHKYPYLRWSYISFLTGFILASLIQAAHMLFGSG